MHPLGPLDTDDHPLETRQQPQREADAKRHHEGREQQRVGAEKPPAEMQEDGEDMADDQDRQIGGAVIGTLRGQILAANGAVINDLEITHKKVPLPAIRAMPAKTTAHRRVERPNAINLRLSPIGLEMRLGRNRRIGHGIAAFVWLGASRR